MNPFRRNLVFGLITLLSWGASQGADCADPKPLRFALIPKKNTESQAVEYRPLIEVLEKALARRVVVVQAASYGTVVEGLLAGTIDVAELGPASYAQAKAADAGITAFASFSQLSGPRTESTTHYRALLIVRRDKGFDSIASLRNARVSLIDPASTSGSLIPRQAIAKLTGVPLDRYFGRVTFAGSHDRAIGAVQKGIVDAAFVSSSRVDEALRVGSLRPDELGVVWQSSPIHYDPFVYRGQLCQPLADKIKQTFFLNNPALQAMFKSMDKAGFTHVSDHDYRDIRDIYAARP